MNVFDVVILIIIAIACVSNFGPMVGVIVFIITVIAALIMRGGE